MPASAATDRRQRPPPRRRTASRWPGCAGRPALPPWRLVSQLMNPATSFLPFTLSAADTQHRHHANWQLQGSIVWMVHQAARSENHGFLSAVLARWRLGLHGGPAAPVPWSGREPAPSAAPSRCALGPPLRRHSEDRRSQMLPLHRPLQHCRAAAVRVRAAATARSGWRTPGSCPIPAPRRRI